MNPVKLEHVRRANVTLKDSLKSCAICPRKCRVDRIAGKIGYCRASYNPKIYSYLSHRGEEPPISGIRGSGTIFFSHCNMKCTYCQNYHFSQLDKGKEVTIESLADIMLSLQGKGCHNINMVTPTHYIPQILIALEIALGKGLDIPIVYNTSGYELAEMIKIMDGIVDIYLPDMRYSDEAQAKKYSDADSYVKYNRATVKEMQRQVGCLKMSKDGFAEKGVIIRLLALPNKVSGTEDTLIFIRNGISQNTYLSIMSQYYPTFNACKFSEISRGITSGEYKNVVDEAHLLGLNNGWIQENPEKVNPAFYGTNIKQKDII